MSLVLSNGRGVKVKAPIPALSPKCALVLFSWLIRGKGRTWWISRAVLVRPCFFDEP